MGALFGTIFINKEIGLLPAYQCCYYHYHGKFVASRSVTAFRYVQHINILIYRPSLILYSFRSIRSFQLHVHVELGLIYKFNFHDDIWRLQRSKWLNSTVLSDAPSLVSDLIFHTIMYNSSAHTCYFIII